MKRVVVFTVEAESEEIMRIFDVALRAFRDDAQYQNIDIDNISQIDV